MKLAMKLSIKLLTSLKDLYEFKIASLLPEWLESRNDFNEAKRLIDDIRIDMNKPKQVKRIKKFLIISTN